MASTTLAAYYFYFAFELHPAYMADAMISKPFYERFARTLVIVISPHPDDSVLGAGGLIHRLTDPVAWEAHSNIPTEDRPVVYTIVMTSGSRGVDDEYLRRYHMSTIQSKDAGLAAYLMRRINGAEVEEEMEARMNVLREELRRQESIAEARVLRVKESFYLNLPGIYHNHSISSSDRKVFSDLVNTLLKKHEGFQCLVLVPHRDDMHPVHKLSTQAAIDYVDRELKWQDARIWQYESPWITFSPHQVEIVVTFDGIGMATKAEAMSVHRSQEYRTRYSDVARYRAQMKAETFPELLGGFGQSSLRWQYVEAFQELRPVTVYEEPAEAE